MKDIALLGRINGKLVELNKTYDQEVTSVTFEEKAGWSAYQRSLILLLLKAIHAVGGFKKVDETFIHYSVGPGIYITIEDGEPITEDFLIQIKKYMQELVEKNVPIKKSSIRTEKAIRLFGDLGMRDKEKLFHYRRSSKVNIYTLEGFIDYFYGYMVPSTGCLKLFDLHLFDDGFVLQMPEQKDPDVLPPFAPAKQIFGIQKESLKWGTMLGVRNVGDLNETIVNGGLQELILVQEALQEKKISEIAARIAQDKEKKLIMIAGPSSSGKTSFSHRLSAQLRSCGLRPHPIPMDDYFVEREDTPLDADGKPDFECLEAIDIELFNRQMNDLLDGKRVELPEFNFKTGKKEYKGKFLQLAPEDVLVIEGIHGLDDRLSHSLSKEKKFKIYISALTQLNIDEHNRIPTTDGRLLRRIVRDARTRGTSARKTIAMWPSVRRGEEQYIFPYQEEADVMFNSALIYEFAVMKVYAEPLLFGIGREEPEYEEAKRLLKFLEYFVPIPSETIPNNSLLREFVGGSIFPV